MKNKERRNHLNLILQRSFCIFFLLVIQFTYSVSYGQTQTLTIHESNKTVKEILNIIEKNSEMIFFYTDNDVDLMRKVTLDVNNQTVPKILEELFKNSNTFFRIDGRQVFIAKKPNVVNQKTKPEKKNTKVTGTVKDETNQSVI
ncbi:MAG: STN domain-containing protein [Paludibacter sp.]|nr:STN domain-containing protein [Paludibacter sp.]